MRLWPLQLWWAECSLDSAQAGHGNAVGAGLLGFGVGAMVGSALIPREVYVVPPPPPPTYHSPAGYGPPPWSPGWYGYCRNLAGISAMKKKGARPAEADNLTKSPARTGLSWYVPMLASGV